MDSRVSEQDSDTKPKEQAAPSLQQPSQLFQGVDTFRGESKSSGVVGTQTSGNSQSISEYKITTTVSEFSKFVDVSVDLAVEGLFGNTSLDGKTTFVNQLGITNKSVVVVVNYTFSQLKSALSYQMVKGVSWPPDPLDKKKLRDFFDDYGNRFVTEISLGGQYLAVYVFNSTTSKEQTDVVTALKGKSHSMGGDFTASTVTKIQSVIDKSSVTNIFQQHLIGYSGLAKPIDHKDIPKFINETLPKQGVGDAVLGYKTRNYYELNGLGRASFQPLLDSDTFFTDQIAPRADKLAALISASKQVKNIYDFYGYTLDTALNTAMKTAKSELVSLGKLAKKLADNPTNATPTLPKKTITGNGLPQINVTGPTKGKVIAGGSGGVKFQDISGFNSIVNGMIFIKSRYKYNTKLIELESAYGVWENKESKDEVRHKHGHGDGGLDWYSWVQIPAGKYVTQLKGETNQNMASKVSIWITDEDISKPTSRVIGMDGGTEAGTWTPKKPTTNNTYEVFVGWAGKSGDYVDSLQPLVVTFKPAKWNK